MAAVFGCLFQDNSSDNSPVISTQTRPSTRTERKATNKTCNCQNGSSCTCCQPLSTTERVRREAQLAQPQPQAPASRFAQFNGVNSTSLQNSLNLIAQDPEGQRLLAEAQRRGVRIQVADLPRRNVLGQFNSGNNTITVENGADIRTIVHELVHAVTPEDQGSKNEEATANIIGDRVDARIRGRAARDANDITRRTFPLYPDLPDFNTGFRANLNRVLGFA